MPKDKNKIKNPLYPAHCGRGKPPLLKGDLKTDKPSRFVVDLKKELKGAEEAEKKEKKKVKWGEMYEKISEFDVKGYLRNKKEAAKCKKTPEKVPCFQFFTL